MCTLRGYTKLDGHKIDSLVMTHFKSSKEYYVRF